ncbi:MAG: hypothetical protein DRI28_03225 [Caldiserica bacterium]|nr:MAG: hypothetical protein DRI28_03225 [Caldisericota bacterium]
MDIKDAKLMGGIGSILALLSFIPKAGWIISLVGFILVIIAIKKITDATNRDDVFNDYLKGAIINIVGSIIIAFVGGAFVLMAIMRRHGGVAIGVIVAFVIAWIVMIVGTYFMKKGLVGLSEVTGEKNFATAGNLFFWGAILLIIAVGGIVSLVGSIFQIIAFFSLPDTI